MTDKRITPPTEAEMKARSQLRCDNEGGGKIKLIGTVHTPGDRRVASATAWRSPGATEVENDLIVA